MTDIRIWRITLKQQQSAACLAQRRLYDHRTRTWYSSGADAASHLTTDVISASELLVAITF